MTLSLHCVSIWETVISKACLYDKCSSVAQVWMNDGMSSSGEQQSRFTQGLYCSFKVLVLIICEYIYSYHAYLHSLLFNILFTLII